MDARERYFWDLTGYLVVRNVLTADELSECNAAVDHCMDRMLQGPRQRRHPRQVQHAPRHRPTDPPQPARIAPSPTANPSAAYSCIPKSSAASTQCAARGSATTTAPWVSYSPKGTEGLILHGAGEPHRPYVAYHHQNGQFHCAGVTVTWQLADCKAGDGGFACVPGSHKAKFPMPAGVRSCDEPLDVVHQPALKAGDVIFFMDGAPNPRHPALERRGTAPLCPLQVLKPHRHPRRRLHRAGRAGSLLGRGYRRGYDARATRRHVRPLFQYSPEAAFAGGLRRQRRARQVNFLRGCLKTHLGSR